MHRHTHRAFLLAAGFILLGAGCLDTGGIKTTGPAGVFVSPERGDTWQPASVMPDVSGNVSLNGSSVYKLIDDPKDPNALYWASREHGLFYSSDAGRSWQQAGGPLGKGFIFDVAVDPQDSCTIYATNGRQLFRSETCARKWEQIFEEVRTDVSIRTIAVDPLGRERGVYFVESKGDMYRTLDGGGNWELFHRFETPLSEVVFDPQVSGRIFVASRSQGLYRSEDRGVTWEQMKAPLQEYPGALQFRRLVVYPSAPGYLFWLSTYGILVSRNGGQEWIPLDLITPPGTVSIYGFAANPKNDKELYYVATHRERSTFYRSEDRGATWVTRKLPSGQIPTALLVHAEETERVYVGFTIP